MPIMPSDCVDSARPSDDGRKFNSAIAACTRASASAETGPRPEIARDAVDMPTPARAATSFSVATVTPWIRSSYCLKTIAAGFVEQRNTLAIDRKTHDLVNRCARRVLRDRRDLGAMIIEPDNPVVAH